MPGAGSSNVAWAAEQAYAGGTGSSPTYYLPGTNLQVQTAELNRNLLEIVAPGDVETQKFLAQNLEGQLGASFILTDDNFHRLVFNDGFTGFTSGLANSAEWYLGVNYPVGNTTERQIKGWAPATCTIEYSGSVEAVRVTLTGPYAEEEKNTSLTPGTIQEGTDEVPGHGTTLSIAGNDVGDRLQTATLEFSNISRLQRGASQTPIEAVAGNVSESIQMSAIYDGPELYERVLGSVGASTTQETVDEVTASLAFDAAGTSVADYSLARVAPENYSWTDLVNNDADLNESIMFMGGGVTASDPTA